MNDLEIFKLREKIDSLDLELIQVLKKRQEVVSRVVRIKGEKGIPIEDLDREKRIISNLVKNSEGKLSEVLIEDVYKAIFYDSKVEKSNFEQSNFERSNVERSSLGFVRTSQNSPNVVRASQSKKKKDS